MAPPTISDDATAAGQRSRSRRAPTKSRKPDEPVADDPRATARARPYPEPKSHKATSAKKHVKGPTDRKTSSAKGKKTQAKAQESEEEDAEGEDTGIEEEGQGQVVNANPRMDPPTARPAPLAPRSYYPPSAHPQNYEITDSPPAQKTEEVHPQPQYQPYHEEPPRPNRPTGSLASLADGPEGPEGRPPYPYSTLIRYAIEGSERGKLTLSELYSHIEARFPWFGKNGAGWKNSIRHNLSLNKSFVKIPRPLTEPGKGSYWCINYNVADGENAGDGAGAEPAKRKRNKKKEDVSAQAHPVVDSVSTDSGAPPPAPSVYENPYPTSGYGGQPVAQGYPYPPQQPYPSPHVQQHHTGGEAQEDEEYDEEDAAGEQEATAPYQDQNAAYYAQQQYAYSHPAPQQSAPPMQHSAPVEAVYPNPNAPQTVYYSQHPAVPYAPQYPVQVNPTQVPPQPPPQAGFVDDRPDRTAPRTIYNHAGGPPGGPYGSAAQTTTPLGALATSVPHVNMNPAHPHMYGAPYAYGQYPPAHVSQSPQGYTSSLGGAMGPPPGQT